MKFLTAVLLACATTLALLHSVYGNPGPAGEQVVDVAVDNDGANAESRAVTPDSPEESDLINAEEEIMLSNAMVAAVNDNRTALIGGSIPVANATPRAPGIADKMQRNKTEFVELAANPDPTNPSFIDPVPSK